ncbi:MAG: choice-of-anchor J domain-containing protein [Bacteroidales bacterium]|nr:choice-of-anchor J domain-containing protein [Bacteroidales bacterium]
MRKFFLVAMMLMLSASVIAQQRIQLRSADKAECVKSDMRSLKASFSFSTIEAEDVDTQRGQFSWLSMPNTVIGGNEGDPQIPVVNELIAVPVGANPTIRVTSYSSTDYRLSDLGVSTLIPRQPSLRKDKRPEDVPFVYNANAYQTRGMRSEPQASVRVVGTMRGVQLGKMTIEPVSYDPVNNTLRVFNDIEVEVSFDGADAVATEKLLVDTYSPYFNVVYKQLFNDRMLRDAYSAHPDLYTTPVKMLVVTTSTYANSDAFNTWKTWKIQKGIDVDVLTVAASATASTIKTQIYSKYNSNHPSFLVIVGDETVVTYYSLFDYSSNYGTAATDLEYASVDGDVYHDMFLSRIPVSSTTELSNYVNKALTYEKYTMSDPSYLSNVLLIAGADDTWAPRVGRPTINYAANNYFNTSNGFTNVYKYVTSTYTGCYDYLNSGVGFVNYTAHGDIQMWYSPQLTNTNVNALTNNDKYFWAMGNCCLTCNFKNEQNSQVCFGETMIRAANKAAFGYIGSVPESYWYEDYYFGVGATSTMSSTPSMSQTTLGVYDMMFDDTGFNTLNAVPFAGNVAVTYAHANSYTSSVSDEYYWRAYQCFGDGSIMPYHTQPAANNVSHASTINIGATTFTVSAVAGSYVAITKNNVILGVAEVPSSGTVNVPISGLTSAGDVMIVVTRQQRQPYITTIQAISASGPYISLDSYTPNAALVGQSTGLSMTFKNVGTAATSGTTTVTLSTTDTHVTINNGTRTFGSLAADATTTVSGFSFTLNNGVTLGSNVTLHYRAVNGSNTWEGDFGITPDQVFTVGVSSNNASYGSVSGGGQYHYGASCTVTATPADGYMFTSWTQNGSVVSTTAQYVFPVSSDVDLVANFASGVMIGDGSSSSNEFLPTYNYYKYSLTEQIYTSAELGGAGTITSIAFYNEGAEKTRTLDFYLKATTKSSFSSGTDWISVSSGDKVFSGSVTMTPDEWTTITLSTPFIYDGTSNVVLVTDDNSGAYTNSPHMACRVFTANSQAIYVYSDNTNYSPVSPSSYSGTVLSVKNQVVLTKEPISGEPVNITVSANPSQAATVSGGGEYPFGQTCTVSATPNAGYTFTGWTENGTVVSDELSYSFTAMSDRNLVANFIQAVEIGTATATNNYLPTYNYYNYSFTEQIYTAQEIGTAGTINSIAFYNGGTVKTRTIDLYVKATTKSAFSSKTDWVSMSSSDKVFTGSVTFTAGAWTFINFTTPFEYDGASNIIIAVDDNTGTYTSSPHMACQVFNASSQAIYIYSDGTNYSPSSPATSQSSGGYDMLSVKNHILMGIEAAAAGSYDVVVSANPANGGVVTGTDTYDAGATATLTATANEGYTFTNWTKGGTVVSTNATYNFTVSAATAGEYVANFTLNSYTITATANPAEYGTVTVGIRSRDDLVYDFEDGWQGWTTFQGTTTSPHSWMHNTEYPTSNNDFTTGYGYNNSDGFMLSESYISGTSSGTGTAVTPDNYLVSPQVRLGGSVSFYAGGRNTSYCAEKFTVMVSTTGNTDAASFTTVGTWTLSLSAAGYNDTPYTVDLSAYSGMGYIAIRHYDCYDQWFLAVDDVTIAEGPDNSTGSGTFNHGEACVVTATPNAGYYFANWTEDGVVVSTDADYGFTVTADRSLVANFTQEPPQQTVSLAAGLNWWSTNLDITLADLKSAVEAALGSNGTAIIKSQSTSIVYSNGMWIPETMAFDIREMYKVQVSEACEITLAGVPVNTSEEVLTINPGNNWIGFPSGTSMTLGAAFAGLNPVDGDVVKSQTGSSVYNDGNWVGTVGTLEPGQGYLYYSKATSVKTFTFGMNAK